jgi:hypothetical protein
MVSSGESGRGDRSRLAGRAQGVGRAGAEQRAERQGQICAEVGDGISGAALGLEPDEMHVVEGGLDGLGDCGRGGPDQQVGQVGQVEDLPPEPPGRQ